MLHDFITGLFFFASLLGFGQQSFGAFSDPFLSIQLAPSPANGECLTTDGTNNDWTTCAAGGGGGADGNWSFFNNSGIRLATTTNQVLIGGSATSTLDLLQVYGAVRATYFTATSTTASSTFPNLLSTNSTTTNATSTTFYNSGQTRLGALSSALALSGSTGILSNYAGASCTNQAVTAISAAGAATCTTITSSYVDSSITPSARTITVAGTAQQITSSAGAQDLSANRTWTLSLPSHVVFPGSINAGNSTTTNATSTSLAVLNLNAASCDVKASTAGVLSCGTDATGGGGGTSDEKWATSTDAGAIYPNTALRVGIGTTTPKWALQVASSTGAQLTLSDGSLTSSHWSLRNAGGSLFIGTSSPTTFATSTGPSFLTLTNAGRFSIGSSSPFWGPFTVDVDGDEDFAYFGGSRNSFMQVVAQNRSSGTDASTDFIATNDIATPSASSGYYVDLGINSSTYTNATYSATGPNDSYLYANDADLVIGTASTTDPTANLYFATGGFTTANIRGVLTRLGLFGFGTTTPKNLLHLATSTGSQLRLSDGSATSIPWDMRSINGNFYLSTSSPSTFATSTRPILFISSSGTTTISGVGAATSTQYVYSTGSGKGGSIILEDTGGGACTELTTKAGVLSAAVVTCPAE